MIWHFMNKFYFIFYVYAVVIIIVAIIKEKCETFHFTCEKDKIY